MKIQFASDLHLEMVDNSRHLKKNPLEVAGDVLLLAGDSIYLGQESLMKHPFWKWASDHFNQVIAIPGNHEYYAFYDIASLPESFRMELFHNVHICSNTIEHIGDIDIIASTLWAHIDIQNAYYTEQCVSDFHRIMYGDHLLTFAEFNQEHERCLKFIKQAVNESKAKTKIVLTHHVPTGLCTAAEFSGSTINGAFSVELGNYIAESGIDYWIYGHSHRNIDAQIGDTLIISNQLGYVSHGEHLSNGFNPGRIIDIQ
jgi:predicted phosphodiesterase